MKHCVFTPPSVSKRERLSGVSAAQALAMVGCVLGAFLSGPGDSCLIRAGGVTAA